MKKLFGFAFLLAPLPAQAHGLGPMATPTQAALSGARAVLSYPETLLPLLAIGLLLAMWDARRGLPRALPALLVGLAGGVVLSPLMQDGMAVISVILGLGSAVAVAAAGQRMPTWGAVPLAVLGSCAALGSLIHGQPFDSLPMALVAGLLVTALLAVALPALAGRMVLSGGAGWRPVVMRIAASWLAAILLLILAFTFRSL